jgi:uncharacterized membrane protein
VDEPEVEKPMTDTLVVLWHSLGHFHPALVHFPVGLLLTGAALEAWQATRDARTKSTVGRVLLVFGTAGALLAVVSGLVLFHPGDFQGRTLAAARVHRLLGLCTAGMSVVALVASALDRGGRRLRWYRLAYFLAAALAGLAGHYGGWVVFGWGKVWIW